MNHIDLFSGIGGFAYAAREVWGKDYHNILFCDNNKFCQEVLKKNFGKDSVIYGDIREYITWLVIENVVKYISCEQKNKKEQILEIFKKQLNLQEKQKKFLYVNIATKNMKHFRIRNCEVEGFVQGNVGMKECVVNLHQMQMAEIGCKEKKILIGKMGEVGKEINVTTIQKQLNGEEEYLRGIDILAKIADIFLKNQNNLTPTTLLNGLMMNEKDLIYQMALLYALNATIGDIKNDKEFTSYSKSREPRIKTKQERGKDISGGNIQIDLLTGGFPCQSFSQAGKRKGTADTRYLWPEMYAIIRIKKPTHIVAENVRGLLTISGGLVFEQVCSDLEGEGYEVQPFIIPAVSVNAPHRRDRVWFVANRKLPGCDMRINPSEECDTERKYSEETRQQGSGSRSRIGQNNNDASYPSDIARGSEQEVESCGETRSEIGEYRRTSERDVANSSTTRNTKSTRQQSSIDRQGEMQYGRANSFSTKQWERPWLEVALETCSGDGGVHDGIPERIYGFTVAGHRVERLKALGNSIVPQVAIEIMKAIKANEL